MIRDITIGQYFPGDSVIHRLDSRVKIIATLLFIGSSHRIPPCINFLGFALAAACLGAVITVSKVPLGYIVRGLKPIIIILLFTFALNMFMIDGRILWQWGFLKITAEGLRTATFMAVRLILLIIGSSMLTLCTRPLALTDGIERLLSPFKKIGLPAHEIAMMMTIALRFIPTLLEETDKIMKAQQALTLRRGISSTGQRVLFRFLCLCLSVLSELHRIWPWQWKQDATKAVRTEQE